LNYRDLAITDNTYPFAIKDNVVPCSDVAGEIVEAAPGTGFKKGDKIVSTFDITNLYGTQRDWNHGLGGPLDGGIREYLTVPAQSVVKLPESSLSFAEWACLPCAGVTAFNALYGNVPLKPGQTVLFLGELMSWSSPR
jgi:NADPH:quinone reductase-like Zn-dependent oxidoreductase